MSEDGIADVKKTCSVRPLAVAELKQVSIIKMPSLDRAWVGGYWNSTTMIVGIIVCAVGEEIVFHLQCPSPCSVRSLNNKHGHLNKYGLYECCFVQ